jgi:glycosyltransferase involved in cell wall biosynthesis
MVNLGIVVFGNHSGLGNQTRRLTQLLKPSRILYIDSRSFSQNGQVRTDWYDGFTGYTVKGFPNNHEINVFLRGLSHVLVCENPLNFYLFQRAKQLGIKTFCQSNYEFCDNLIDPDLPLPDLFLMPSYWHLEDMAAKFGSERVKYLPPPMSPQEFKESREINFNRKGTSLKLLHVVGTLAAHDRNGTLTLLESLSKSQANFALTIHSQRPLPELYMVNDPRVRYSMQDINEVQDVYKDYDAVIMPRRYGGLSLVMNEALMSGLPVIMPDISPNNKILPKEWLIPAKVEGQFLARVPIDVHAAEVDSLVSMFDYLVTADLDTLKTDAFDLGYSNFSDTVLREQYEALFQ